MNDLISRQAAIDALDGKIEITGRTNAEAVKGYVRLVKDRLEHLPSAQPDVPDTNVGDTDCISRADVIELVNNSYYNLAESIDDTWAMVADVEKLPPVTPKQPGWIPTSERLPDNDRAVLVTLKWAEDDYEVAVGEYWHNSTASHGWGSFEGHVIAWHELPTPYREGGQE